MAERSIKTILQEANNSTDVRELNNLWNEIVENKYSYSLNEIELAKQEIQLLVDKQAKEDSKIVKNIFSHILNMDSKGE